MTTEESVRRSASESNVRTLFALMSELGEEVCSYLDETLEEAERNPDRYSFPDDFRIKGYGKLYELSVQHIAAYLFKEVGLWEQLTAASREPDPNAAVLELARTANPKLSINEKNAAPILASLCVLAVNLHAIASFHFSMPELLKQAAAGDDMALLKAVRIDPSVLQTEVAADRVSTASFLDDRPFFHALSQAIKKTKPSLPKPHLDETRLLLHILDDAGDLLSMTNAELTEWAVNRLQIYPPGGDPLSAVRDQRRKREKAKRGPKG